MSDPVTKTSGLTPEAAKLQAVIPSALYGNYPVDVRPVHAKRVGFWNALTPLPGGENKLWSYTVPAGQILVLNHFAGFPSYLVNYSLRVNGVVDPVLNEVGHFHNVPGVVAGNVTLQQGVGGYSGCLDTWLDSVNPTTVYFGQHTSRFSNFQHVMTHFDISSVPAGATITKAQLTFWQNLSSGGVNSYLLHASKRTWHLLVYSWTYYDWSGALIPWQIPGGTGADDIYYPAQAQLILDPAESKETVDVTALVSAWHDGTRTNYGFLCIPLAVPGGDYWYAHSANYPTDVSLRPKLYIEYEETSPYTIIEKDIFWAAYDPNIGSYGRAILGTFLCDPIVVDSHSVVELYCRNFAFGTVDGAGGLSGYQCRRPPGWRMK